MEIDQAILRVAISAGGKQIAGQSRDGKVILWELATGKKLHTLAAPVKAFGLLYSLDGKRILSPSEPDFKEDARDGVVIEWDAESGKLLRTLEGPKGWLPPLATHPRTPQQKEQQDNALKITLARFGQGIKPKERPANAGPPLPSVLRMHHAPPLQAAAPPRSTSSWGNGEGLRADGNLGQLAGFIARSPPASNGCNRRKRLA